MIDYGQYMQSKEWSHKRLLRLKVDYFRCRTCWNTEDLEVHHLTYERLGNEEVSDLITLCKYCHEVITCSIRERKYKSRELAFENVKDISKELRNDLENINSKIEFSLTSNPSQWQSSRPNESYCEGDKETLFKTEKDRCRLY